MSLLIRRFWKSVLRGGIAAGPGSFMNNLEPMDYSHDGMPFVEGPASETADLQTMDYSHNGLPFVRYAK